MIQASGLIFVNKAVQNIRIGWTGFHGTKCSSLLDLFTSDEEPKLYTLCSCDQFQKHFTSVTYAPSKISCTIYCKHAPIQCFFNALAYFSTAVSYGCKCL